MNERMSKANFAFREALKEECIELYDLNADELGSLRTAFLKLEYRKGKLNSSDWSVAVAEGGFKFPKILVDELINAIPANTMDAATKRAKLIKKLKPAEPKQKNPPAE